MAKRTPPPGSEPPPSLPHNHTREDGQPNAKEVDDYKKGVAAPPEELDSREANSRTTRARTKK